MRRFAILALLAFLAGGSQALSAPGKAAAPQATFGAVADTYVTTAAPRSNFGRARVLRVGPSGGTRTYLRFQVRGLTEPVRRVTLRVHSRKSSRRGIQVRATSSRWSERRLTARNAPRPIRVVGTTRRVSRGWVSIALGRAVSGNGTFNFVLTALRGVTLSSREGGRRPQLIVETEPAAAPQTLVAAGDIADGTNGDEQTAALVDTLPGTVAALGDLAYENGSASEFATYYEPTWGRFKARTRPAAGNHEYGTANAAGYFGYWGAVAGQPTQGWYSYELGAWHVIVLNSNCPFVGGCHAGSPQETWLRADLAAHPTRCTLAYWHHPRFSTGVVGDSPDIRPLFQALYDANADVLLVAHAHNYQRWSPLNPTGAADAARGIRQFVVGTGGRAFHEVSPPDPRQEIANDDTFGVLRLLLSSGGFHLAVPAGCRSDLHRLRLADLPLEKMRAQCAHLIVEDGWQRGALAATRSLGRAGWDVGIGSPRPGFAAASRFAAAWHEVPPPEEDRGRRSWLRSGRQASTTWSSGPATGKSSSCRSAVTSWMRPSRTARTRASRARSTRSRSPRRHSALGCRCPAPARRRSSSSPATRRSGRPTARPSDCEPK